MNGESAVKTTRLNRRGPRTLSWEKARAELKKDFAARGGEMTVHVDCSMCLDGYIEVEFDREDEPPYYDLKQLWNAIEEQGWIVQRPLMDIYCSKQCAR